MSHHAGIVGYRGYSGAELVRILDRHPHVSPVLLEHREEAGGHSRVRRASGPRIASCDGRRRARREGIAVVFLATPADVSMELAPAMLDAGAKVVDLSGAFRLRTPEHYARWYKEPHTAAGAAGRSRLRAAGILPRAHPAARLVANPGCYPTAANLAIRPLVEAGVIDRAAGIVCDAKSGVSGAGRKPTLKTSFCEVTENFSAYSILNHRHVPEVLHDQRPRGSASSASPRNCCRSIAGFSRPSISARAGVASAEDLLAIYEKRYAGEPFIRLYQPGPRARSARRGAHQFLRYRRDVRCGDGPRAWW